MASKDFQTRKQDYEVNRTFAVGKKRGPGHSLIGFTWEVIGAILRPQE